MVEPTYIEIEPTLGCNLRCRMCHTSFLHKPNEYLDFDKIDFSFIKGKLVTVGAVFEPFIHPKIDKLINILNRHECRIILITNGHNLHKKRMPSLLDSDLAMVTFSFDGISRDAYELVRAGGNYERTLENIERFRGDFSGRDTLFAVNYTVMRSNLNEVPEAPAFWDRRDFDILRFISMVVRESDEFMSQNSLWEIRQDYFDALTMAMGQVKEQGMRITLSSPYYQHKLGLKDGVFIPEHPDAKPPRLFNREYLYGAGYGAIFPCKAPFLSARILWDGTVTLCHDKAVGNLYRQDFNAIWEGGQANAIREVVTKSTSLCNRCDYFRLCLNSHFVDLDRRENYFSGPMLMKQNKITPSPLDFVGIGAPRCGATWVDNRLRDVNDIVLSDDNDVCSFAFRAHEGRHQFFPNRNAQPPAEERQHHGKLIGTSGNLYLFSPDVCNYLAEATPHVKIYLILRDPIERAISAYKHQMAWGGTIDHTTTMREAIRDHNHSTTIINYSFYDLYLMYWLDAFPRDQIKIILYEDIRLDSRKAFLDLAAFLGLSDMALSPNANEFNDVNLLAGIKVEADFATMLMGTYSKTKKYIEKILNRSLDGLWLNPNKYMAYTEQTISEDDVLLARAFMHFKRGESGTKMCWEILRELGKRGYKHHIIDHIFDQYLARGVIARR